MFGIITNRFINNVHECFDELRYLKKDKVDYSEFVLQVATTMSRCKTILDVKKALYYANYCVKHWKLIEKLFEKKLDEFNEIAYTGNDTVHLNSENEIPGILTTNFFKGIDEDLLVSYINVDGQTEVLPLDIYKNGKIRLSPDAKYYATFTDRDVDTVKVFNSNNQLLFNMVMDDNCNIFIENNGSQYDTINTEDGLYICSKEYSNSVQVGDPIDFEKMIGEIQWDTMYKNNTKGVSMLYLYVDDLEDDIIDLFILMSALTYLLLEHSYKETKKQLVLRRSMINSVVVSSAMRSIGR